MDSLCDWEVNDFRLLEKLDQLWTSFNDNIKCKILTSQISNISRVPQVPEMMEEYEWNERNLILIYYSKLNHVSNQCRNIDKQDYLPQYQSNWDR